MRPSFESSSAVTLDAELPADEALEKQLTDHTAALDLLVGVAGDPLVAPLLPNVSKVLVDGHARTSFLAGLRASPGRAAAIVELEKATAATGLFAPEWAADVSSRLRAGSSKPRRLTTSPTASTRLKASSASARSRRFPRRCGAAAESLAAQSGDADAGLTALRREILAVEIRRRLGADPRLQAADAQRLRNAFDRYRQLERQKRTSSAMLVLHRWTAEAAGPPARDRRHRARAAWAPTSTPAHHARRAGDAAAQVVAVGQASRAATRCSTSAPSGWPARRPSPSSSRASRCSTSSSSTRPRSAGSRRRCRCSLAARRVVIAGDPQAAPADALLRIRRRRTSDDEEIETDQQLFEQQQGEIEDLLAAALELDIQQCYLDVHYRSRNADLIEFSNEHFYGSRLQADPRPSVATAPAARR